MKIVMVASEVVPFAKTGGLADVAGALPIALEKLGCEVIIDPLVELLDHEGSGRVVPHRHSLPLDDVYLGDYPLRMLCLPGIMMRIIKRPRRFAP